MTTVVLTFTGSPARRQTAMENLRRQLPDAVLTPKTATLIEAQLDEAQMATLQSSPEWTVSRPSFAEIAPPGLPLKAMRRKLSAGG